MKKILEKTLKDAIKEKSVIIGSKRVLGSLDKVKLIISSNTSNDVTEKISSEAEKLNVPIINYDGNSVALGRLSGFEYRISTISFTKINDSDIKSLMADIKL
jgi:large subunit ribosomal protein L30e